MNDIEQLFNAQKPIIGMSHFGALPGDPRFDPSKGLEQVVDDMIRDISALQYGGVVMYIIIPFISIRSAKTFKINIIKHYRGYNPSDPQSNNFHVSGRTTN